MPIQIIEKPCKESICAVWHISESLDFFLSNINLEQNPGYHNINHPAKQLQWLASRMLVKELVEKHLRQKYDGFYNDQHGKPWLNNNSSFISISNSKDIATAIIHSSKLVGIDIELIKPKISLIKNKFLLPEELLLVDESEYLLTAAWCCKETLYKIHGIGNISLKDNILIHPPFEGTGILGTVKASLITTNKQLFHLKYLKIKDYMMVYNYYN
ncbi:MAG: 4'-phosphopantetheinyl transferase superfamily protein [Cytophagales bacterium]|nr:MAG: 4'-phosphopantetheinyl transferase superfamily protein [Cytophagales bacterium]